LSNIKEKLDRNPSLFLGDLIRFKTLATAMESALMEYVAENGPVQWGEAKAYYLLRTKKVINSAKADRYAQKNKLKKCATKTYTPASLTKALGKTKAKEVLAELEKFDAVQKIEYSIFKIKP